MALLQVSYELDGQDWWQRLMKREFNDFVKIGSKENCNIYRIQHDEIPKEDKLICFECIRIADNIEPIIIRFNT